MNTYPKFINGIEYIEGFAPIRLKKAMEYKWAESLIKNGDLRLISVLEYRKSNRCNPLQRDLYEDIGIKISKGVKCTTDSANPTYIWCCSHGCADNQHILETDTKYNCVILINDPQSFFSLIREHLVNKNTPFLMQAGPASYDKEQDVEKKYFWGENSFQKHEKYSHQHEFRFVVTDSSLTSKHSPFIDLKLGDCSSYASII